MCLKRWALPQRQDNLTIAKEGKSLINAKMVKITEE